MQPGWWAVLDGDQSYLNDLVTYFERPDLQVIEEGGTFYLGSTRFAEIDEPRAIFDEAARLVGVAVGGATLELGRFETPHMSRLPRFDEDGSQRPYFPSFTTSLRIRVPIRGGEERTLPDGSEATVEYLPAPRVADYAGLAINDVAIEDALTILGREDVGWRELYLVFELVQDAAGGRIWRDGWATKPEVDHFTQAANSREAVGRDARHGHTRIGAPKNQPTLDEARQLVARIVAAWLETMLPERGRVYFED